MAENEFTKGGHPAPRHRGRPAGQGLCLSHETRCLDDRHQPAQRPGTALHGRDETATGIRARPALPSGHC